MSHSDKSKAFSFTIFGEAPPDRHRIAAGVQAWIQNGDHREMERIVGVLNQGFVVGGAPAEPPPSSVHGLVFSGTIVIHGMALGSLPKVAARCMANLAAHLVAHLRVAELWVTVDGFEPTCVKAAARTT